MQHYVFNRCTLGSTCILLVVYADDIVCTGDDKQGIEQFKSFSQQQFQTKDLGAKNTSWQLKWQNKDGIVISQKKCVLYLLKEIYMLGSKPVDMFVSPKSHLC